MAQYGLDPSLIAKVTYDEELHDFSWNYHIPNFEKQSFGYVLGMDKHLSSKEEWANFIKVTQEIGNDIEHKYGERYAAFYSLYLNRYFASLNPYSMNDYYEDSMNRVFNHRFSIDDTKTVTKELYEHNLIYIIKSTYQPREVELDLSDIRFTLNEDEKDKEQYVIFPFLNKKGVMFSYSNEKIEVLFHVIPLASMEEIQRRIISSLDESKTEDRYCVFDINELCLDMQVATSDINNKENLVQKLEVLGERWIDILGADLSSLNLDKAKKN